MIFLDNRQKKNNVITPDHVWWCFCFCFCFQTLGWVRDRRGHASYSRHQESVLMAVWSTAAVSRVKQRGTRVNLSDVDMCITGVSFFSPLTKKTKKTKKTTTSCLSCVYLRLYSTYEKHQREYRAVPGLYLAWFVPLCLLGSSVYFFNCFFTWPTA